MLFTLWLIVRLLTRLLVLPRADDDTKDLESWSCGSSFGCYVARPAVPGSPRANRAPLAAASRVLPRQRWASSFLVTPQTLLRWHRTLVRQKWTFHKARKQPNRVDGEEVAGKRGCSLVAWERPPAQPVALQHRRQPGLLANAADQHRRDRDCQLAQFADNADVAPLAVLAGQPQDQLADILADRRPSRPPVRVGPAAGDQPPMPAQQRLAAAFVASPRMRASSGAAAPG
jgi:hypothetical protein